MNKDKWTQQLRDKLAEREVAAPDDLWADIEAALPKAPVEKGKRRPLLIPLRRWAIAASLAALVAGGGFLWRKANQPDHDGQELAETTTIIPSQILEILQPDPEEPQTSVKLQTFEESLPSEKPAPSETLLPYSEETLIQPDEFLAQQEPPLEQTTQTDSETVNPTEETKEEKSADETIRQLETQIA
ncbi:MAG: hypothetical protein J6Q22_22455, partial [Prevotella sp.]|nr:hypothetical protein [Prevotella sp.]